MKFPKVRIPKVKKLKGTPKVAGVGGANKSLKAAKARAEKWAKGLGV